MFAVSYVIIFVFHPVLDTDCVIIIGSFGLLLREIVISEMFSAELNFAADCLLKWFNKKFKSNNLELSNEQKRKYEINHPFNWK